MDTQASNVFRSYLISHWRSPFIRSSITERALNRILIITVIVGTRTQRSKIPATILYRTFAALAVEGVLCLYAKGTLASNCSSFIGSLDAHSYRFILNALMCIHASIPLMIYGPHNMTERVFDAKLTCDPVTHSSANTVASNVQLMSSLPRIIARLSLQGLEDY